MNALLTSLLVPVLTVGLAEVGRAGEPEACRQWLARLLMAMGMPAGAPPPLPIPPTGFRLLSAAQDYGRPTPDLACHTRTPLQIGERTFAKGIGAHANGRIEIELLRPFRRFHAFAGIDNNWDTAGTRGSAEFIVRVDGEDRFHSPVHRGGEAPLEVDLDLTGARRLELIVTDAGDGINYDQADWAEAALETLEGDRFFVGDALADQAECPFAATAPASFDLDGRSCWEAFPAWERSLEAPASVAGGTRYRAIWRDPASDLEATLTAVLSDDPPALELGWELANRGASPSSLITNVCILDLQAPSAEGRSTLLSCSGGLTGDFSRRGEPVGFELAATLLGHRRLTTSGGRSSNGDLPFFLLKEGLSGWGVAAGLGWSGQWQAEAAFDRDKGRVVLTASLEPAHFRLPPGEAVRLPTVLIIPFRGADGLGANRLRRVLRRLMPPLSGEPVLPPVSFNSWFVFDNRVNETMLCELADRAAQVGIEYFCLDAGWFDGDFPDGVGNWTVNRAKFPNGLKAVADHVHALGMKFGLWFEPERVASGTRWEREHPELVHANLLDLGRPPARALLLEMMSGIIGEVGVDWIRYDFNIDPLVAWQQIEGEEEQGLRQIEHINGLYAVLDELMRRHPGLLIEQCSSGGRRIDLETVRRGHTIWKSDNTADQALMRFHETGGNLFLPGGLLNTNLLRWRSAGEAIALFAGPLGFGLDLRELNEAQEADLSRVIAAYKRVRHFINQDYYPLFPQGDDGQGWNGWQFLDPAAQEGFFAVYCPPASPYSRARVRLSGLEDEATYRLEELLTGETRQATGQELATGWEITLAPDAGQVWHYVRQT